MKAISLWQPWAALCVLGAKQYETRHWSTSYRGPLLIHAAAKQDREVQDAIRELGPVLTRYGCEPAELTFGALIGRVTLVSCQRMRDIEKPSELEQLLGNWSPDRYAWKLEHPETFAQPPYYRGSQGLFNVDQNLYPGKALVRRQPCPTCEGAGGAPNELCSACGGTGTSAAFDPTSPKSTMSIP